MSSRRFSRAHASQLTTMLLAAAGLLAPAASFAAPPVLEVPGPQTVNEGQLLAFTVSATDPEGQAIELHASGLPAGALFTDHRDGTGAFSWTPAMGQKGSYAVSFLADDTFGGIDVQSVAIEVMVGNTAPVLSPIGDRTVDQGSMVYVALSGWDEDGDALQFRVPFTPPFAAFTDHGNGAATLVLSPTLGTAPGAYPLTAYLSDGTDEVAESFTVVVAGTAPPLPVRLEARAWFERQPLRLQTGKPHEAVCLEPIDAAFALGSIDFASVRLLAPEGYGTITEIAPLTGSQRTDRDRDGNGVPEMRMDFAKADLRALLAYVGAEEASGLVLTGSLTDGTVIEAPVGVGVIPMRERLIRTVGPNPVNPQATIGLEIDRPGRLRVRVYDLSGRLVRSLVDDAWAPAGTRDVRFDGRDDRGRGLASGRYFLRVESAERTDRESITILK